ncbi:CDC73-domain-containing protein [Panus rudis PR-1116 ss-1]|nr:CDC73-domain-containing protein [Panus rudis PR-1116 ss-1]
MSSSTDPLLALREAITSKTPITFTTSSATPTTSLSSAHNIIPSSTPFPKSTPTRLRKPSTTSTDPSTNPGDFYTLEAVYLVWSTRDASSAEYMKQTRELGLTAVGFVSVTDRKSVVDWLEGRVSELEGIVPLKSEQSTTPPSSPPAHLVSKYSRLPGSTSASTLSTSQSTSLPTQTPSASRTQGDSHAASTTSPTKRRYVADTADIAVVKKIKANEIELRDRRTVLRGEKVNNFTNVRTSFAERLKKLKEASKSGSSSLAAPSPDPKLLARKAKNMFPIIIISSSPTALITMHNVKRFLQDSVYEPSQEVRARTAQRPEDMIPLYRKKTTMDSSGKEIETSIRYFIVDSTEALAKFGTDAWDRVVCVMTTGQTWQFKPYKWSDPKILFHHVKGFYVSLTTDPPNTKIRDWNVTELKLDPHRRHVDRAVVAQFWKTLDAWMMANKPWLVKS